MKRNVFTPLGRQEVTLTQQQIEKLASEGDIEARREILKQDVAKAKNTDEKVEAILKCLGA